jgi:cytoskeletal protein CcmA (bactofilin family)
VAQSIANGSTVLGIPVANGNIRLQVSGTENFMTISNTAATWQAYVNPCGNNVYNLGTAGNRWNTLYTSANGVDFGGATITSNATAVVITNPAGGQFVVSGNSIISNLTVSGNIVGGNISTGGILSAAGNLVAANLNTNGMVSGNSLNITGNAVIGGNLAVNGNVIYINITELNVQDPIISMGRGPNNAPLSNNDGLDRGEQLWYYTTSEKSAFIGLDNSAQKLFAALDVSITNEIVTVNSYGNFVAGNIEAQTLSLSGNVTSPLNVTGNVNSGNVNTGFVSATGNVTSGNVNTGFASVTGKYIIAREDGVCVGTDVLGKKSAGAAVVVGWVPGALGL